MTDSRTVSPAVAALAIVGTVAALAVLGVTPLGSFVLHPVFADLLGAAYAGVVVAAFAWTYRDAERRGWAGWIVAPLVALTWLPVSLAVWLAVRPAQADS